MLNHGIDCGAANTFVEIALAGINQCAAQLNPAAMALRMLEENSQYLFLQEDFC
jgi:hypothetical protein